MRRLAIVLIVLSIPYLAPAQEPEPPPPPPPAPEEPATTLVTGSRRAEPEFTSPRATTIVTSYDLVERASRSTPEALVEEAGVFVQRTNHGGGAPVVRGQLGNRILLLVDGIRLNNSTFRLGPNQYLNTVDPLLLDKLEVVRGPGSALYGSDAIGAVINTITEKARTGFGGVRAAARLAGATMDQSAQLGLRVGYSAERWGALATGSFRHFGDLRGGGGVQPYTGYEEWSAAGSAVYAPAEKHEILASFQAHRQDDVPRSDRSFPLDFRVFSEQQRTLAYLRWSAEDLGPFYEAEATVSYNRQHELQTRYRVTRDQRVEDEVTTGTIGVQIEGEMNRDNPLVVGAELYVDDVTTAAADGPLAGPVMPDPPAARYPEGTAYLSTAIFAHHELPLARRWKLSSELRLGLVHVATPADDRLSLQFPDDGLPVLEPIDDLVPVYAGGAHVRWEPVPWAALSAGLMLGFRAPNVDDYARAGAEGPGFSIPGRDLSPERAYSGELGVKLRPGGAQIGAFYAFTYIDDAIARQVSSLGGGAITEIDGLRILEPTNVDSARYHSIELAARVPVWRRLSLFATFAFTHGTQTSFDPVAMASVDEPTTKTPPAFGTLGATWRAPRGRWFTEGLVRFAFDQTRLSEIDLGDTRICPDVPGRCAGTEGWVVATLRGGFWLSGDLRATLVLENLGDASYRYHASGVQAAGFGASAMVEGEL